MTGKWLEVSDKERWVKKYPLEGPIIYIGSQAGNEIVLDPTRGGGVAQQHLQLFPNQAGYTLTNLAPEEVTIPAGGEQTLPQYGSVALNDGDTIQVGEFILRLCSGDNPNLLTVRPDGNSVKVVEASNLVSEPIGLELYLPIKKLTPDQRLEGRLIISNQGGQGGVKIELSLEGAGFDADCYWIEPGPQLASDEKQEKRFQLRHRGHKPPAGPVSITFRAAAPRSYPGFEAVLTTVVEVAPVYKHRVRLIRSPGSEAEAEKQAGLAGQKPVNSSPETPENRQAQAVIKAEAAFDKAAGQADLPAGEAALAPERAGVEQQSEIEEPARQTGWGDEPPDSRDRSQEAIKINQSSGPPATLQANSRPDHPSPDEADWFGADHYQPLKPE